MEAKVILFHSNESDKCKAFINNDVSLITSKNRKDDIRHYTKISDKFLLLYGKYTWIMILYTISVLYILE